MLQLCIEETFMTPERFTDWLQGFVEIQQSESITDTQWLIIKDHLKLVFDKKTPDRNLAEEVSEMDKWRQILPSLKLRS